MKKSNINQENTDMVQHAVYDIVLHQNNQLSAEDEEHYNIYYEIDEDGLYDIDNMILDEKKENKE